MPGAAGPGPRAGRAAAVQPRARRVHAAAREGHEVHAGARVRREAEARAGRADDRHPERADVDVAAPRAVVHLHGRGLGVLGLPRPRDAAGGRALPAGVPRRGHGRVPRLRGRPLAAVDLVQPALVDDRQAHAGRADLRNAHRRNVRVAVADGMSLSFRSTTHPGYVHVVCEGSYSLDAMLELLDRIFVHVADAGRDAVLTDVRALTVPEPTMADRYTIAVHIAELQAAQRPRIRLA